MSSANDHSDDDENEDAQRAMATAVRGQTLVLDGWLASHADSGTPGPHIRLWAPSVNGAVIRSDQLPELIEKLEAVRRTIDELWVQHGEIFVAAHQPWVDDNDPDVMRQQSASQTEFVALVRRNFSKVAEILLTCSERRHGVDRIANLLGIDPSEVEWRLDGLSLLSMAARTSSTMTSATTTERPSTEGLH